MARFALKANRIDSCLHTLKKRLSSLTLRLNAEAATKMKIGQYDSVKELMDVGTSITKFSLAVDELTEKWRIVSEDATKKVDALGIGAAGTAHAERTTAKQLCIPALKTVVARGGTAKTEEIISDLEPGGILSLSDADLALHRRNNEPRWHVALERAHKQCERRGWIEARSDDVWAITPLGRKFVAA